MPVKCIYRLDSWLRLTRGSFLIQSRPVSTHVPGHILRGDDLGPTRKDAHATFRLCNNEKAQALPLPPSLDPVVLEQKLRWEQPKKQPKFADFTPFQKKLWENPFAHVLASPVRQCRATLILLPVALLTSLHTHPHPTTNDPWLLPVSLTTDKKHLGSPYHFLSRHFIAAQLGKKKAWERVVNQRMIGKLGSDAARKIVWREDMPDFILELMRQRLVQKLSWNLGHRGRLKSVASPRPEDIGKVQDVSCVLLFRSLRTRADDLQDRVDEIKEEIENRAEYFSANLTAKLDPHSSPKVTHKSPGWYAGPLVPRLQPRLQFPELEFKSTMSHGRKIPVYSLVDLLGEEKAQAMMEASKYKGKTCLVMKRARHNVPVEMMLMQLQAYMARPGP